MQDISNYKKIREDANEFYKKIGCIKCPVLNNELVYFNAEGFNHLILLSNSKGNLPEV